MAFVQYPRALVRLACAQDAVTNYLDEYYGHAIQWIDRRFYNLVDKIYFNYMEGTSPDCLFPQEEWLNQYDRIHKRCETNRELLELIEHWHNTVGEYRMWIVECGLEPADILEIWDDVTSFSE
jgi:hypothetical protein